MTHPFTKPRTHFQPERLRPAREVVWSEISPRQPSFVRRASSGRRKLGVQYEARVHWHLQAGLRGHELYWPGPWFRFLCSGETQSRWCQPDGLHFDFDRGLLTLVEMKYTHTADSWWWVEKLYIPVVRSLFPAKLWTFRRLEVVHTFDPAVSFPVSVRRITRLDELEPHDFGVLILKEMSYEQ